HNITPGPIVTARELLGDMLLEAGQAGAAVQAYETSLGVAPNRFKALYGVAKAAERAGDRAKAKPEYDKLLLTGPAAATPAPVIAPCSWRRPCRHRRATADGPPTSPTSSCAPKGHTKRWPTRSAAASRTPPSTRTRPTTRPVITSSHTSRRSGAPSIAPCSDP